MTSKDKCCKEKFIDSIADNQYSNLHLNNNNNEKLFEEIFKPKNLVSDSKKFQNYGRKI